MVLGHDSGSMVGMDLHDKTRESHALHPYYMPTSENFTLCSLNTLTYPDLL